VIEEQGLSHANGSERGGRERVIEEQGLSHANGSERGGRERVIEEQAFHMPMGVKGVGVKG